jgi:hypothetical protein
MRNPSPRAGARATGLLLIAIAAFVAPPAAPAAPAGRTAVQPDRLQVAQAGAGTLTVAVRDLPPGRRTLAQIAAYYYGARQMSFVLEAANPWLTGIGSGRNLAAAASHARLRIPVLRGPRTLGPSRNRPPARA